MNVHLISSVVYSLFLVKHVKYDIDIYFLKQYSHLSSCAGNSHLISCIEQGHLILLWTIWSFNFFARYGHMISCAGCGHLISCAGYGHLISCPFDWYRI